jgi:diguanylate cyclase (GGDEF)-like protein
MLVNSPSAKARSVCERLREELSQHRFESPAASFYITVSIGFVSITAEHNDTSNDMMQMASQALREAKALGPNRVEEFRR